jgi:phage terminase large subunit
LKHGDKYDYSLVNYVNLKTKIKIEPIGVGEYIGFELDGDHLFLLEDGTVMHNSHSIARYLVILALQKPIKILCTRELQNSITESVYVLLKDIITKYQLEQYFTLKLNCIDCINGSTFIFKGLAHNIESVKSTEGVDICWIEEADKVSQNSWDILVPTIRKPDSKIIVTFNPTHEDDPVYEMFIKTGQPNSIMQKVNYTDNPYFPYVLLQELEHMRATDYDRYLHVWEGELRTISDAQVFKGKFVVESFETGPKENFYHGMDFGFAKDPTTIVRCFIRGNSLFIDREQFGHHIEINNIPAMIHRILEGSGSMMWKIRADCARPETISYLKNLGYNVDGAPKWPNSVEEGIEYLKSFQSIVIHPTCTHAIEEFKRYSYKVDKRTNDILPIVIDDYNHILDSIRYAVSDLIKRRASIYDEGVL